ncbi:MAG: RHS repeat-associated core domain-containing protein [Nitrospira sp.]|nr:RHS repeat-associated core domain-containing protein [Nitrospira sp.]
MLLVQLRSRIHMTPAGTFSNRRARWSSPIRSQEGEFDAESGLSYYRARYYDPASGRFLQQDPGSAGINSARLPRHPLDLVSQYVYAADNPIQLIDSFGNEPQEPGGWVSKRANTTMM